MDDDYTIPFREESNDYYWQWRERRFRQISLADSLPDSPLNALPYSLIGIESLDVDGLESFKRTEQAWEILSLDPHEDLYAHDWKEKGILRDYYAKLHETGNRIGYPILDEEHGDPEEDSADQDFETLSGGARKPESTTRSTEDDLQDIDLSEPKDHRKRRRRRTLSLTEDAKRFRS